MSYGIYDVKEAAAELKCHHKTLLRWIKSGRIKPTGYVGKEPRFDFPTLENFMKDEAERKRQKDAAAAPAEEAKPCA